jgi:hypothetical protein
VLLVGARRHDRLARHSERLSSTLTADDLAEIESAPPGAAAGDPYDASGMVALDSERGGAAAA